MAYETGSPLGFFFGNDSSDPRVNQQLRQRIALAMMARDKKYPRNVGEGLSAIGDAIAERKMMQSLLQGDLAQQSVNPPAATPMAAASPATQSYAPPDSLPPAVAAINSAASQGDQAPLVPPEAQPPPPLETAPSQPASMLAPQMPTSLQGVDATPIGQAVNPQPMLPPQAPPPGPQAGADGYNMLDAQAGLKRPGSGRTQDAVMRAYPNNPDMQAYLSSLSAGEWRGPGDVSSTGARGPWQFVPGTARQYGLSNPDDVDASAMAAKQFTQDNAATFERINGRPPTMAELAVMHQQGGTTGANMVAGTGNASPRNLSLNNVDPGAGPGAAVARIKGYYGLPDRPVDTRDAIASQLLAQGGDPTAPAVPPPNPTMTGANGSPDQRLALAAPQGPASDIQSAPPMPSGIRAAPPVQMAQAQPQAIPGYVPPPPGAPQGPPIAKMSQREAELTNWLNAEKARGNPYAEAKANAAGLQDLQNERITRQNAANEMYKAQIARDTEQFKLNLTGRMDQSKRIQDLAEQQQKLIGGAAPTADPRVLGTPQSPQRTGIPTVPPVPPGITPQQWAEKQAPEMVKAVSAVEKATPQFSDMMDLLKQAREHPGREWGIGKTSDYAKRMPGTDAYGFGKIMDQIGGKNFLNAYQSLKGGGSITEIEGSKAEAAQARLATAQTRPDFDKAMVDFEKAVRQDMETVQRKVNRPVTAWRKPGDNETTAPDIGQRSGDKEYIGGNPADPMSWRRVQ